MANLPYPQYASQPYTGQLPGLISAGPSDLRATSGVAPYWRQQLDDQYGRHLAGLGSPEVQDERSIPAYTQNELDAYAAADDANGTGIFDPPDAGPTANNLYPDAGIFAGAYAFPGYLARERLYKKSEVVDATTGRPVVYVNGGAVSMDSAAQIAFLERGLYAPPRPVIQQQQASQMPKRSIANWRQHPVPVDDAPMPTAPITPAAGLGQSPAATGLEPWKALAVAGGIGLAFGALYSVLKG